MKQIDLEPKDYRKLSGDGRWRRIWQPPKNRTEYHPASIVHQPAFGVLGALSGLWAGVVIGYCRFYVEGEDPWAVAVISLLPLAVWGLVALFRD